ncbi:MAG: response regulator [Rhodoferax sp.]|uniref:response regulator n=1 Tax=Rhodoferax sp. TaxID=50421 RepID=UPI002733CDA5|nr:response regulator [Rhodoferax sp.]MDP2680031.1 response regulator [Rhodoferax sp.]
MSLQDNFSTLFTPEFATAKPPLSVDGWKVLLVDDEPDLRAVLRLALCDVEVEGRPLRLMDAASANETKTRLTEHPDIALILLDVAMETEQAGLELIRHIREALGNHTVQIILVTGQPGYAPQREVMQCYEINGYQLKSELHADNLHAWAYAALRTHRVMCELQQQKQQLESQAKVLARWQHMFEHTQWGVLVTNADSNHIDMANPNCAGLYGYSADEFIGLPVSDLFAPEERAKVPHHIHQAQTLGHYIFESRHIRKDGVIFPVLVDVTAVKDANGNVLYRVANVQDITLRKQTETESRNLNANLEARVLARTVDLHTANQLLARAKLEAEAANVTKSAFLANMSHEIRTQLNAMMGFSNMLRIHPEASEKQRDSLNIICNSGKQLLALINNVLDMAKIDAGNIRLDKTTFDLGEMVREVTDMMHLGARDKGLQLTVDPSSRFPDFVHTDALMLRQTLINLLGNAIKFTEQGHVTLRVKTVPGEASQQLLIIEVEDSGIGINAADQDKIFEPFAQINSKLGHGSGLGLTITHSFMTMMGGRIRVQSALGTGSLFRVELLIDGTQAPEPVPMAVEPGRVVDLAPKQNDYRILIVEDQLENALLLKEILNFNGLQLRGVDNGKQGVEAFAAWQPHLIWMDILMPVMDGLEATQRIRAMEGGRDVKIIAVTASGLKSERDALMAAGMDAVVRKPYQFIEIYEALTHHLGVKFTHEHE